MPIDPFGPNPFGSNPFGPPRQQNPYDQPLAPDEEEGLLRKLGRHGLSALGWLGGTMDKAFGGRAIRGVLGGRPDELASLIPFSDTLGITDEANRVSGKDILSNMGLVDKGDEGWGATLGGIGTEMLLDPASYLTFGAHALTKAGKAAEKLGQLPGGSVRRLGYDVLPSTVEAIKAAKGGGSAGEEAWNAINQLFRKQTGADASIAHPGFENAVAGLGDVAKGRYEAGDLLQQLANPGQLADIAGQGTALGGVANVQRPWFLPNAIFGERSPITLGAGEGGQKFLEGFGKAANAVGGLPGVRSIYEPAKKAAGYLGTLGRANFDADYRGSMDPRLMDPLKQLAPDRREKLAQALMTEIGHRTDMDKLLGQHTLPGDMVGPSLLTPQQAYSGVQQGAEGVPAVLRGAQSTLEAPTAAGLLGGLPMTDAQRAALEQFHQLGGKVQQSQAGTLQLLQEMGLNRKDLGDFFAEFSSRRINPAMMERFGETPQMSRAGTTLPTSDSSSLSRADVTRDIPGGADMVNELVKNPHLAGSNRLMRDPEATDLLQEMLVKGGFEGLAGNKAAELNEFLKGIPSEAVSKQLPYYTSDVIGSMGKHLAGVAHLQNMGNAVMETLARAMIPESEAASKVATQFATDTPTRRWLPTSTGEPVNVANRSLGPTLPDVFQSLKMVPEKAMAHLSQMTATPMEALSKMHVPADLAADMAKTMGAFTTPESLKPVLAAYDKMLGLFKGGVTVPFPSFHARNLMTSLFNMWRDDSLPTFEKYKKAWNIALGHIAPGEEDMVKEAFARLKGLRPDSSQISEAVGGPVGGGGRLGLPSPTTEDPRSLLEQLTSVGRESVPGSMKEAGQAINPFSKEFLPVKLGSRFGELHQQADRLAHYMTKLDQGFSPQAAADAVNRYHFDYSPSAFTPTEKMIKRAVPFFSFASRNLPMVLEDALTRPGKMASALRGANIGRNSDQFTPEYIQEKAGIPLEGAPPGYQRYLSSFGLPMEEPAIEALGNLLSGHLGRGIEQVLGQTSPMIKAPVEWATGRQLMSGRQLEDLRPTLAGRLGGILPEDSETAKALTQLISNLPTSRAASTFEQFMDERKSWPQTALNLGTGIKLTDVDTEKARRRDAQDTIEELLKSGGHAKTFNRLYVPADQQQNLSGGEGKLLQLYNQLERDSEMASLAKKAASGDQQAAHKLATMKQHKADSMRQFGVQ